MKTLTTLLLLIGIITTSCSAQQKIANIKDQDVVKTKFSQYKIRKDNKTATIENVGNKLSNVDQLSPNLPKNINLGNITKYDENEILKILVNIISQNQIQEAVNKRKNAALFIRVKSNLEGVPIELEFLTDENSNINLSQIQDIETAIRSNLRIKIDKKLDKFLKGSNFISTDITIWLRDLVK